MTLSHYERILHYKPTLGLEEELVALNAICSGLLAQGEEVKEFENEICTFIGLTLVMW